jgi:hypothetical protein
MAVRWFDPHTHDVVTSGRAGEVTHILDGTHVPYVARPYKTILLEEARPERVGNIVDLAQLFDLSVSAMKATLGLLANQSDLVKEVRYDNAQLHWILEIDGRRLEAAGSDRLSGGLQSLILLELAGIHARHHARVEPTFLLLDGFMERYDSKTQIAALERLQHTAEHAQVAIVSHSEILVQAVSHDWTVTTLEHRPYNRVDSPVDFEVETRIAPYVKDDNSGQS